MSVAGRVATVWQRSLSYAGLSCPWVPPKTPEVQSVRAPGNLKDRYFLPRLAQEMGFEAQ